MEMITEDVKGKRYNQLINLLTKHCDRFAFVENRQLMEMEEERLAYVDELISDMKEHLLERKIQREWETTKLRGATAYVYYFQMNSATKLFLRDQSDSLFGWTGRLPEDLMFYQKEKCLLAVCSHEGFFMVDENFWKGFLSNTN
ncbi:stage III sporulation protein AH [Bacillus sp. m3-13]|uniref:stage III sporulation protein AH n=1 Tax=Bacillus sp. m3-13 TaxID=406124 RepID=UPI001F32A675|nr:stage III sporulation protein AH [Bacillus sp. m3-13]